MQISQYTVGVKFKLDQSEFRKIDKSLKVLEAKLKAFSKKLDTTLNLNLSSFKVDQKKLNTVLGNALDVASTRLVFDVSRFNVDQSNLNRVMSNAMMQATRLANKNAALKPGVGPRGGTDGIGTARVGRAAIAAGGVGGIAARAYGPALALGLGGYGLSQLNRRNQEIVSATLGANAVLGEQGPESMEWLKKQANRIGFNWLEMAPEFTGFMGAATPIMGHEQSLQTFQAFNEFATTRHAPTEARKRAMYALKQMASMPNVMSQELFQQIGEAQGFGEVPLMFAEAWAKKSGSGLVGKEALYDLKKSMKAGLVKTADVLPDVTARLAEKAEPTLKISGRSAQAEQARSQNAFNAMAKLASEGGIESGFARLFRTLNVGLTEATPMVESLAHGFDNATKVVSAALLSVQSFQRFFQGRDSLLGDRFFSTPEDADQARVFLENMKTLLNETGTLLENSYKGWLKLFDLLENNSVMNKLNSAMSLVNNSLGAINALASGDYSKAEELAGAAGKKYVNAITTPGRFGANLLMDAGTSVLAGLDPRVNRSDVTAPRFNIPFNNTQSTMDYAVNYKAEQAALALDARNKYALPGINQPLTGQNAVDLKIDMSVDIKAANPEDFNNQFQDRIKSVFEETLLQYTQKE